jgi:hypothetical protein
MAAMNPLMPSKYLSGFGYLCVLKTWLLTNEVSTTKSTSLLEAQQAKMLKNSVNTTSMEAWLFKSNAEPT